MTVLLLVGRLYDGLVDRKQGFIGVNVELSRDGVCESKSRRDRWS